jgi:methylmalonyl-CoA/ethylmalonyl-CoA epimerase
MPATTPLKGVHHVTYIVEDVDRVIDFLDKNFDLKPLEVIDNQKRGLRQAFYKVGHTIVDFFQPMHEKADFYQWLKQKGPGISHVGFSVEGIDAVAKDIVARDGKPRSGGRSEPTPNGYRTLSFRPEDGCGILFQLAEGEMKH